MEYEYAYKDKGSTREITLNHHGRSEALTLEFRPMESLLYKITPKGASKIDLGYDPS